LDLVKKIDTRKGDSGETSLSCGVRVTKDSVKIECNSNIDDTNSSIVLLRVKFGKEYPRQTNLFHIQKNLMKVMEHIAHAGNSIPYNAFEEVRLSFRKKEKIIKKQVQKMRLKLNRIFHFKVSCLKIYFFNSSRITFFMAANSS